LRLKPGQRCFGALESLVPAGAGIKKLIAI
jgi:hypothetical protein